MAMSWAISTQAPERSMTLSADTEREESLPPWMRLGGQEGAPPAKTLPLLEDIEIDSRAPEVATREPCMVKSPLAVRETTLPEKESSVAQTLPPVEETESFEESEANAEALTTISPQAE